MRRLILAFSVVLILSAAVTASPMLAQSGRGRLPNAPPPEDCLPYDTTSLEVVPSFGRWLLAAPHDRMFMLETKRDGLNALALAKRYRVHCFIGRHASRRPSVVSRLPPDYQLTYWKEPTGVASKISPESCTPYDPARLTMADKGAAGWIVTDGKAITFKLDDKIDAETALRIARSYTSYCVIGHNDFRPPSGSYAPVTSVDYWK